jgi:hypothetical protein
VPKTDQTIRRNVCVWIETILRETPMTLSMGAVWNLAMLSMQQQPSGVADAGHRE